VTSSATPAPSAAGLGSAYESAGYASSGYSMPSAGPSAGPSTGERQATGARPAAPPSSSPMASGERGAPRTVRLTLASIDPFSAMKLSFLLSVAAGIALVVASIVLWSVLNGMGVFDQINGVLGDVGGAEANFDIYKYVGFGRVVSISTVLAVINVLLITALSTIGVVLYNIGSGLVGGLHVTLSDD